MIKQGLCLGFLLVALSWGGGEVWAVDPPVKKEVSVEFNSDVLFPTWESEVRLRPAGPLLPGEEELFGVRGIIGKNKDLELPDGRSEKLFMVFIPRAIDILFYAVAPIVVVMFLFSGIRLVYAGDSEEDIAASKKIFQYALMGTILIVLSFSFLKTVYLILAVTPTT